MSDQHNPDSATPPPPAPPVAPPKPKSPLATASLVIAIIAAVCAFTPILSFIAFVPAFTALGLGIAAMVKHTPRRGRAIAAIIIGALSFVIAISVSVGTINGAANSVSDAVSEINESEIAAEEEPDAVATPEPEAEPEPTEEPAPAPAPVPADIVYQGAGDSILTIEIPDGVDAAAVATISHNGARNFTVWALDVGMAQQDLLVNTIGGYQGTVLFNDAGTTSAFEISADGAWTVTVRSILSLREFAGPAVTGFGDDVVIYRGEAGAGAITHDGASNFTVWAYGTGTDLVVNEIGPYTGTVRWAAGPSLVEVSADGNWSIAVG